jgi:hypothetical protein
VFIRRIGKADGRDPWLANAFMVCMILRLISAVRGRQSNSDPLRNAAAFAELCGASIDASIGKQVRHHLNRSGDRRANSASGT